MPAVQSGQKVKMAQYGTKHGHAEGVLQALFDNPDVEVAGVYEPDVTRRKTLQQAGQGAWAHAKWFDSARDFLDDPSVVAVSSEGLNVESLAFTEEIVRAGKHCWYDKPAGDDWPRWQRVVTAAREKGLLLQLGYMFRYHEGFSRIADWARSGFLGHVFSVRAHMSTNITQAQRRVIADHDGGILYDLGGHMLDQVVWILGRPRKVTAFHQNVETAAPAFKDNALGVFEYEKALATVDIAAMETKPMARRFEVYGTRGSAIMEPFEPLDTLRLCLDEPRSGFNAGVNVVRLTDHKRYDRPLAAFVKDLRGEKQPDRPLDHELLVQETLLRATGKLPA